MSSERSSEPSSRMAPRPEETERAADQAQEQVEAVDKGPGAPMQHGENR